MMEFDTTTYYELNGVLVKFWKDHGVTDKSLRICYLERLLRWYKRMGVVTLDETIENDGTESQETLGC